MATRPTTCPVARTHTAERHTGARNPLAATARLVPRRIAPAIAPRLITLLAGAAREPLFDRLCHVAAWTMSADRQYESLVRRLNDGDRRLRQAVQAWDRVLPALHRAVLRAQDRLVQAGIL